jgi:hypothetical protein
MVKINTFLMRFVPALTLIAFVTPIIGHGKKW